MKLEEVTKEIHEKERERQQLKDDIQAARGKAAAALFDQYGNLKQELNRGGYERFTSEDQSLWARLDENERLLKKTDTELQRAINEDETGLENLRGRLKTVGASCRELDLDLQSAKKYVDGVNTEKSNSDLRIRTAEARLGTLLQERGAADKQKGRNTWAYLAMPTLALVAVLAFFLKVYTLGWAAAAAFVGTLVWVMAYSSSIKKDPKDIDGRATSILKELGLQTAATLELSWNAFDRYRQTEEQRTGKMVSEAEQKYQDALNQLQGKNNEYKEIEFKITLIEAAQKKRREDKRNTVNDLEDIQKSIQGLRDKTGKAGCEDLAASMKEKERLEQNIVSVKGQLEGILGPEAEWHGRLASLKPYFDQFPDPRPEGEIEKIKDNIEKRLSDSGRTSMHCSKNVSNF